MIMIGVGQSNISEARPGPIFSESVHNTWKLKVIKYGTIVVNLSKMVVILNCLALISYDPGAIGLIQTLTLLCIVSSISKRSFFKIFNVPRTFLIQYAWKGLRLIMFWKYIPISNDIYRNSVRVDTTSV